MVPGANGAPGGARLSVLVLGDINADLHWVLPAYPAEGDDATARDLRWGSGGAGTNMAVMLARLGARATLVGTVGTDPAAAVALRCAADSGVELDLVRRDPALATGLCSVAVADGAGGGNGERTFFSFRGANAACTAASTSRISVDDARSARIDRSGVVGGVPAAAAPMPARAVRGPAACRCPSQDAKAGGTPPASR